MDANALISAAAAIFGAAVGGLTTFLALRWEVNKTALRAKQVRLTAACKELVDASVECNIRQTFGEDSKNTLKNLHLVGQKGFNSADERAQYEATVIHFTTQSSIERERFVSAVQRRLAAESEIELSAPRALVDASRTFQQNFLDTDLPLEAQNEQRTKFLALARSELASLKK